MNSRMHGGGPISTALVLALGVWIASGPAARADGGDCASPAAGPARTWTGGRRPVVYRAPGAVGPALNPGYSGFGLKFHPGYGYGGDAVGVGPDGGYPFYGGPGYPHPAPSLRRLGGINPFPYYGGPGHPAPGFPHYFGGVGPLVVDPEVVTIGTDRGDAGGYGPFTGAVPDPEARFSPATAAAATEGPARSENPPLRPAGPTPDADLDPSPMPPGMDAEDFPVPPEASRSLGIDAEPVVDAGGVGGMKVSKVYPESTAEKAGLQPGDVIRAINGQPTTRGVHLTRILAGAAPGAPLTIRVRTAGDGTVRPIAARLP